MFCPVRRRISMITLTRMENWLAWGAWAGSLTRPRRAEVACQRSVTPRVKVFCNTDREVVLRKVLCGQVQTPLYMFFVLSELKTWSRKDWLFGFLLSGISDSSFHLRLASMEASWTKGRMHWLRHNRIYWLHVNWPESVILGRVCRKHWFYLNLQRNKSLFCEGQANIKIFIALVLLKCAREAHVLEDYPLVIFGRWW